MLLQLLARDLEALGELVRVEIGSRVRRRRRRADRRAAPGGRRSAPGATGGAGRSIASVPIASDFARAGFGASASCASRTRWSPSAHARRRSSGSSGIARPFWRSTQPASGSIAAYSVSKTPSVERPGLAQRAVHPPGGVSVHLDPRRAGDRAVLPVLADPVGVDVEVGGHAEVALAAGREADVAADPRDAERAHVVVVEVLADDVPGAAVAPERVRVQRALAHRVAPRRPVAELDRALLRDRGLELREPARHLRRVVGIAHLDARSRLGGGVVEAGAPEREVLEREPERLGVRERAVEHVERRLERRQLVVVELELVEEVVLGAERVELLAGELVALRVKRDAEGDQLGAVGVEAARERLVGHLGVALDVALDVACGERPPLRHQERDQRELPDQLVGVVRH